MVSVEASVGIEYCQAPISELRLYRASIAWTLPIAPLRDQVLDLVVEDRAGVLAADLEDGLGLLLRGDDRRPFLDGADHRLLAVDGLARLHRVDRHPGVPVVGHADQHGVDVLAGEDLAIVDIGLDLAAEDLLGVRSPALVQVGGGDQLDAGHLERRLGVDEADDAHADRGDPDAVVRPGRLRRLDRGLELVDVVGERVVATVDAAEAAATDLRNDRRESSSG